MLKSEIQEQINRVRREIGNYERSRDKAKSEQKELIAVIDKIGKKASEIEDGLQQTLSTIDTKLSRVNQRSRFPELYRAAAKERIMNSKSSNALSETKAAIQSGQKKCSEYDETIKHYSSLIRQKEYELERLKRMLLEAVE